MLEQSLPSAQILVVLQDDNLVLERYGEDQVICWTLSVALKEEDLPDGIRMVVVEDQSPASVRSHMEQLVAKAESGPIRLHKSEPIDGIFIRIQKFIQHNPGPEPNRPPNSIPPKAIPPPAISEKAHEEDEAQEPVSPPRWQSAEKSIDDWTLEDINYWAELDTRDWTEIELERYLTEEGWKRRKR